MGADRPSTSRFSIITASPAHAAVKSERGCSANDLTIEHVPPDVWIERWPLPDGTNAPADLITGMTEIQIKAITKWDALKHTLGNLTLLTDARNPSLGNRGFAVKREKLKYSLLKLNHEIAALSEWTEKDIQNRAQRLAHLAVGIWPGLTALLHDVS